MTYAEYFSWLKQMSKEMRLMTEALKYVEQRLDEEELDEVSNDA